MNENESIWTSGGGGGGLASLAPSIRSANDVSHICQECIESYLFLDVDECYEVNPCGTEAENHTMCRNTEGGFECSCVQGYTFSNEMCEGI